MPIIPMLLVNGSEGMATGYSTNIPSYNPLDLVEWIEKWLDMSESQRLEDTPDMEALKPWYRGYKGKIELNDLDANGYAKSWTSYGIITKSKNDKWYDITELPVGLWINDFKQYLDDISDPSLKDKNGDSLQQIKDYEIKSMSDTNIHIRVQPLSNYEPNIENQKNFASKLKSKNSLNNMYAINEFGYPIKFSCVEHLLDDFCKKRLEFYLKRKVYLLKKYNYDREKAVAKSKFFTSLKKEEFKINKYKDDDDLFAALTKAGYKKMTNTYRYTDGEENNVVETVDEEINEDSKVSFDYLINISVRTLTDKNIAVLDKEAKEAEKLYHSLSNKKPEDLWKIDLGNFKVEYKKFLDKLESDES